MPRGAIHGNKCRLGGGRSQELQRRVEADAVGDENTQIRVGFNDLTQEGCLAESDGGFDGDDASGRLQGRGQTGPVKYGLERWSALLQLEFPLERYPLGTHTWPNGPVVHSSSVENVASRPPIRHVRPAGHSTRNILRRFFGLVAGIRPSLLAQVGLGPVGADYLSRDGRDGWRVAMEALAADATIEAARLDRNGERCELLDTLTGWIALDRELEQRRWQPAEMALRHLQYVLTADGPMVRQDERCALLGIWGKTLTDLTIEVRLGDATIGSDAPALTHALDGLAEHCVEGDLVRERLAELCSLSDPSTPSPLTFPLAPPCTRADLATLLGASSPPTLRP